MNIWEKPCEDFKKIPPKEEVDPKVEVDGYGSPKTRLATLVLLPQNSNNVAFWRK